MRRILAPALFAILLATLLVRLPGAIAERSGTLEQFDPLIESRRILREQYVRPVDDDQATLAAVDGYVASLGDPFTQFVPPADEEAFTRSMRGEYAGIGAEVNMVDGRFTIISPMPGSPALEAGLRADDVLVAVEGTPTEGLGSTEIIDRLVGPVGTQVTVTVEREGETLGDRTITRRRIVAPTVRGLVRAGEGWHWCLDAETGIRYVRMTQFNDDTAAELAAALEPAAGEPFAGLVLDLRDNPGGGLPSAIRVSDLFLTEGVIVRVNPRAGDGQTYSATPETTLSPEVPMVVLINENAASASEILAGALQEAGRAVVVGMRTYGKGSVQQVRSLETAGGTLKFTVAAWELGSGRRLQRFRESETWGVDPTPGYEVPVSDREYADVLLRRRAIEGIRESDEEYGTPPFSAEDCRSIAWVREELGDRQLAVAAEALATRIRTGDWPDRPVPDAATMARRTERLQLEALRRDLGQRLEQVDARLEALREQEAGAGAEAEAEAEAGTNAEADEPDESDEAQLDAAGRTGAGRP